jgi:uncharacterized protein (DUF2336 family)
MIAQKTIIDELEESIASKNIGQRADVLRQVTDLFVSGSAGYSDEQIALFDDVMDLLSSEIETSARASFGHRLAALPNAPPGIIRTLAFDDVIEVAGPVLAQSDQLDDETLIEGAKTKSQEHLLAISRRKVLTEAVTDVLVERGNQQVAQSTAENPGARFSEFGYSTLVKRSAHDAELALRVWTRPEIPRQHLLKLFADVSEIVRLKLEASDRRRANMLRDMVARASNQIQAESRDCSADYAAARAYVQGLFDSNQLTIAHVEEFANEGKFDETTIALSLMCDLSIGMAERALTQDRPDQILVLAKAIGLSWTTARALLVMQATTRGASVHELDLCLPQFNKLKPDTAKKALQFYRLRERAATPEAKPN